MPIIVDKEKKRRQILDAAIAVFSRTGYRRTKISDIAVEAGIGKGTVYEYFRSKQELFLQMCEHLYEQYILTEQNNLRSITDPVEQIRGLIGATLEKAAMWTGMAHIFADMWSEVERKGEEDNLRRLMDDMLKRMVNVISGQIRAAQSHGTFKDYDADLVAHILIGVLDGLMLQLIINQKMYDIEAMTDTLTNVIVNGLRK